MSENEKHVGQQDNAAKTKTVSGKENPIVFQLTKVTKIWPGAHGFELTVPNLTIHQGEKVAL